MKKVLTVSIAVMVMAVWTARAADAKALYEQDCAKCHGVDGKGETKMGKKLGAKDYTDAKAIKEGLKDKDGKSLMKPAEGMSDEDIKGLVAYMRSFKK